MNDAFGPWNGVAGANAGHGQDTTSGGPFGPWPGDGEGATQPTGVPTTPAEMQPPGIGSGIPYWEEAPDIWDVVTIAGFTFPGVASVAGEPKRKLDKKNAKGAHGRTITDNGADGVDIEIVLRLWTAKHWINYQLAIPFIDPNKQKGKLKPVDIIHPALKLHNVKSMFVESVTFPQTKGSPQMKEVRIKATSWAPPPKKPKKSKSKTDKESTAEQSAIDEETKADILERINCGNITHPDDLTEDEQSALDRSSSDEEESSLSAAIKELLDAEGLNTDP